MTPPPSPSPLPATAADTDPVAVPTLRQHLAAAQEIVLALTYAVSAATSQRNPFPEAPKNRLRAARRRLAELAGQMGMTAVLTSPDTVAALKRFVPRTLEGLPVMAVAPDSDVRTYVMTEQALSAAVRDKCRGFLDGYEAALRDVTGFCYGGVPGVEMQPRKPEIVKMLLENLQRMELAEQTRIVIPEGAA